MDQSIKEKIIEALIKSKPNSNQFFHDDDWHSSVNQYNHTVFELYNNDVLSKQECISLLGSKG